MSATTEDAALVAAWRRLMGSYARTSEALDTGLRTRHGLSLTEFEVLQRLAESPEGHRRMQDLATEIHLSPSALSRLVARLEREGLAFREICADDRRGIYATLTEAGRAAHDRAVPTHREILAAALV